MEALENEKLSFLKDVPVTVSVELGRKKLLIKDLLKLEAGSVIEFAGNLDESLNIFVNDILIARGEFVLLEDKLSVRIIEIVNPDAHIEELC